MKREWDNRVAEMFAEPEMQLFRQEIEGDLMKLVDVGIPVDVLKLALDRIFRGAPEHEVSALLNAAIAVKQGKTN